MLLVLSELSTRAVFVMRGSLTVPLLHTVAGAFITNEYTPFQEKLRQALNAPATGFSSYCVDYMPGSTALITFSTLVSPRVYSYNKKAVRIRPPDVAAWSIIAQEADLQREPSLLVSDRKGYVQ